MVTLMMTVLVCSLSVGISLALCNETLSKENEKATKRQVKTFQVKTNQRKEQKFFNTGKKQRNVYFTGHFITHTCLLAKAKI